MKYIPIALLLVLAGCAQNPDAVPCAVDVASHVAPVASNADPAAAKAVNSAVTAGAVLASDPACQAAIAALKH